VLPSEKENLIGRPPTPLWMTLILCNDICQNYHPESWNQRTYFTGSFSKMFVKQKAPG
jgi:hypothetical protein